LGDEIEAFPHDIRDMRVLPLVNLEEIRAELEQRYTFETPISLDLLTEQVIDLLRRWNTHGAHPRCFGIFKPSIRQASIVAETLAALYNPNLSTWSLAPAAQELERLTLHYFARALGMVPGTFHANFTTGGSEANLSAVLAALAHHFPQLGEAGLFGLPKRPAIYITSESHHSFVKVARMTGLGTEVLREVPVDSHFIMDTNALETCIQADVEMGLYPFMIVGTAGTTSAGLVDPLPALADIARTRNIWFHVDAAWGGSAILSPRLKPLLRGIEQADSITWDAHKWLSVPVGAGMFFCRHIEAIQRAFAVTASYMSNISSTMGEALDPYTTTAQWSRYTIGLKVFMALAEAGAHGYCEIIEWQAQMGDYLRSRLKQTGWEVVNQTELPVICFTHPALKEGLFTTNELLQTIYKRGRVWISDVILGKKERALRACITSFETNESDIECLLEELEYARQEVNG
jgi:aromatic-L-amino-acid/L-tryptophan decarboxylase